MTAPALARLTVTLRDPEIRALARFGELAAERQLSDYGMDALGQLVGKIQQRVEIASPPAETNTVLPFTALGLDPADLGFDVDDEHTELYHHDGAFLVVDGFDGTDPESVRAVADWYDALAAQAAAAATELRDIANAICTACSGTGTVGPDDADCPACSGYGRLS